jgi:hypothetical protein
MADISKITALDGVSYDLKDNLARTLISDKADDSNVVHISTDETVTGGKTFFGYVNAKNDLTQPNIKFTGANNTNNSGEFYYYGAGVTGESEAYGLGSFVFKERSPAGVYVLSNYSEVYSLPTVNMGRTNDAYYDILTSKNAVTIAQGGTGATTASDARTALGLGDASVKTVASSISAGSTDTALPTSAAVASFVEGKGYITSIPLTLSPQATGFTISGGTSSKTLTVSDDYALGNACTQTIANNLTTNSSGYVLDARQGKALSDAIAGKLDVTQLTSVSSNSNRSYNVGDSSKIIVFSFGASTAKGAWVINVTNTGGVSSMALGTGSALSVSTATNKITVTNSGSNGAQVWALVLAGSISDVT